MLFIAGLGNPGSLYATTRHNVGFMVVDELMSLKNNWQTQASKKLHAIIAKNNTVTLIKPHTFMNNSGQAVRAAMEYFDTKITQTDQELNNLYVIHDDLDIELGSYKIQLGKGPKIHNGLLSLYEHLKTTQFWHVRVGVDGRGGRRTMPGHAYVLQAFLPMETAIIKPVINQVATQLNQLIKQ